MKTTAKVFIWIGMIFGCILIFPIIVGCFALSKLNNARKADEVKTMGILTLLFCSQIGGIIMLCLKDEDLIDNIKTSDNIQKLNEVDYSEEKYEIIKTTKEKDIGDEISVCTFIQIPVVIISFILTIFANYKYFDATLPFIISLIISILFIINLCLHFSNKDGYTKANQVLDILILIASIVFIIATLIVNYNEAYTISTKSYYSYYYKDYYYYDVKDYCSGSSWELWLSTILGLILFIVTIVKLKLYYSDEYDNYNEESLVNIDENYIGIIEKEKQEPDVKKEKVVTVTNKMEIELNDAKRLYDNKVITKTEYDKIRESIISKYYK